jgi:ribonuclease PH
MKYAEGSCLVKFGNTHVICTASVEDKVPPFLRNKGMGWVTAEYSMLPRSTNTRIERESSKGKLSGRTQEIQRLIGRALRAIIVPKKLGERQIHIDCDVIQADGGTRTSSICGGYIALAIACKKLIFERVIHQSPIIDSVAAISCGIVDGTLMADLDYNEDSNAHVDANFVMTGAGKLVEVQATGEDGPFTNDHMNALMLMASNAIKIITKKQAEVLAEVDFDQ